MFTQLIWTSSCLCSHSFHDSQLCIASHSLLWCLGSQTAIQDGAEIKEMATAAYDGAPFHKVVQLHIQSIVGSFIVDFITRLLLSVVMEELWKYVSSWSLGTVMGMCKLDGQLSCLHHSE